MKRFLLGGLTALLGCLVAPVHAEQFTWRRAGSTSQSAPSTPPSTSARGPVALQKPMLVSPRHLPRMQNAEVLTTTYYSPHAGGGVHPMQLNVPPQTSTVPSTTEPPVPTEGSSQIESIPLPRKTRTLPEPPLPSPEIPGTTPPLHGQPMPQPAPHGNNGGISGPDWSHCQPGQPCGPCETCYGQSCESCYGECCEDCESGYCQQCGGCPCTCCKLPRFWVRGEYLLWGVRDGELPPLVTTTNLSQAQLNALQGVGLRPGALGQLGTNLAFGGDQTPDFDVFHGGRFTIGWAGRNGQRGFEATFFFLSEENRNFFRNSAGGINGVYRPFINANPARQGEDAQFVALGGLSGSVSVENPLRLWGIEFNHRRPWRCGCNHRLDFLAGFRHVSLIESLVVRENLLARRDLVDPVSQQAILAGTRFEIEDSFGTSNRFYGGQIGADFEYYAKRWIFGVSAKVALGVMDQEVNINGSTILTPPGMGAQVATGGLLTQATNIGSYSRNQFAVVPEFGLRVGYKINDNVSVHVGYDFLFLSNVVRAGDQVDRTVNATQLPFRGGGLVGDARPVFIFNDTSFWAHGLNAGLKCKW